MDDLFGKHPLSRYDQLPDTDYAYATLLTRPGYLQGVQVGWSEGTSGRR